MAGARRFGCAPSSRPAWTESSPRPGRKPLRRACCAGRGWSGEPRAASRGELVFQVFPSGPGSVRRRSHLTWRAQSWCWPRPVQIRSVSESFAVAPAPRAQPARWRGRVAWAPCPGRCAAPARHPGFRADAAAHCSRPAASARGCGQPGSGCPRPSPRQKRAVNSGPAYGSWGCSRGLHSQKSAHNIVNQFCE